KMHQALKRALEIEPFQEFPFCFFVVASVMLAVSNSPSYIWSWYFITIFIEIKRAPAYIINKQSFIKSSYFTNITFRQSERFVILQIQMCSAAYNIGKDLTRKIHTSF